MNGPHLRTLELALKTIGTKVRLAIALGVSVEDLETYLGGERLPHKVFIDALQIVSLAKP